MSRSRSLDSAFQAAQPELQNYVIALEAKNLKLQKQIAHLQTDDLTKQHRIVALENELKELTKKHGLVLNIGFSGEKPIGGPGDRDAS